MNKPLLAAGMVARADLCQGKYLVRIVAGLEETYQRYKMHKAVDRYIKIQWHVFLYTSLKPLTI